MARMIEGEWEGDWRPTDDDGDGEFVREPSRFRDALPDGTPEPGRYHLFVAWTCPWAHRTLIARSLKRLTELFPIHFANELTDRSWRFETPDESRTMTSFSTSSIFVQIRSTPVASRRSATAPCWTRPPGG